MRTNQLTCFIFAVGIWSLVGCSSNDGGTLPTKGSGQGATNSGPGLLSGGSGSVPVSGNSLGDLESLTLPPPPGCGNGVVTSDEACDDGNQNSDDGCSSNCLVVEPGFSCVQGGVPCNPIARCGDGIKVFPELCDDGNRVAGDGCSVSCKYETGYKCDGAPSVCTKTTCGDGIVEGAESCEDGNALPFDGCSAYCQNEPKCGDGPCTSSCGDGIVLHEGCDDGNNIDGDGCSKDCTPELGYTCTQPDIGDTMQVPIVYRDFRNGKPSDFQPGATGQSEAATGLVGEELDKDGKPVFVAAPMTKWISSADTFAQWYRDIPGTNSTTISTLTLYKNEAGAYVNRMGPNGERFQKTQQLYYCGNVGNEKLDETGAPIPCTSAYGTTDCDKTTLPILSCDVKDGSYTALALEEELDGNPAFFPVDADPFSPDAERVSAVLPAPMYTKNWDPEPGKPLHNFAFTSEVGYWFEYDASKAYRLEFTGDDDVWVFINGKLAVDIGGIHTPVTDGVDITPEWATAHGLETGKVYKIQVFQAERQTTSSSYKLTLSGFSAAPSACAPTCGDGVVGIGEECDDGSNKGGYGLCGPGCRYGEFCGDGIKQTNEDCDDGVNIGRPCPSGCHNLVPML